MNWAMMNFLINGELMLSIKSLEKANEIVPTLNYNIFEPNLSWCYCSIYEQTWLYLRNKYYLIRRITFPRTCTSNI